ncbi:unnamed protein product [Pieris brassicae]|uniref:Uncharacterized protein n=1 Tax=Pieris brassicae TaxID=7116 RepID=A0A9P0TBG0_PIEBR|nr:unnamed protein product [Pieris brassicae]
MEKRNNNIVRECISTASQLQASPGFGTVPKCDYSSSPLGLCYHLARRNNFLPSPKFIKSTKQNSLCNVQFRSPQFTVLNKIWRRMLTPDKYNFGNLGVRNLKEILISLC